MVTRLLADLGADVLKVEPPGGSPGRHVRPTLAGTSIGFAMHNANKRSAVLNPLDESDRRRFLDLAASADIVVDCGLPGQAAAYGASCAELADRYRHLVALSITDFGAAGPRLWRCRSAVVMARDRSGAVRDEWCSLAVGPYRRHAGTAAGRYRFGNRSGAGSLGRTGRLFQPITLWYWGLHRLLPV